MTDTITVTVELPLVEAQVLLEYDQEKWVTPAMARYAAAVKKILDEIEEPPLLSVVIDDDDDAWQRRWDEKWHHVAPASDRATAASWRSLCANYGPLRIVYNPDNEEN